MGVLRSRFFALAVLCMGTIGLVTGCWVATQNSSTSSSWLSWPYGVSDLTPDPVIRFGSLPNGFRYILAANRHPRQRVSMHLYVAAGSLNESDRQQGLAHLLEHMMFNGTKNFPPGKMVEFFQRIGMQFGPDANAHTGFDRTVYDLLLPKGDRRSITEGLMVLRDYADGALLLEDEIRKESKVVLAEMRTRDSAGYRTFKAKLAFEFPDCLVSRRLPIGRKDILKEANRDLLKDFYDTWYRPENMVLIGVGDFDVAEVEKLVKDYFSSMTHRAEVRTLPELGDVDHQGLKIFYHYEPEAGETSVSIETVENVQETGDSRSNRKEDLLFKMAAWIIDRRLEDKLSSAGADYTEAWTGSYTFLNKYRMAEIGAQCDPVKWKQVLADLEETLRSAIVLGVSNSELERAKRQWQAELDEAVKQSSTRTSRKWAREILSAVGKGRVILSPVQRRDLLAPIVAGTGVEDINRALQRMWGAKHRLVAVTGNLDLGDKQNADKLIAAAWQESIQKPVTPVKQQMEAKFPYLKAARPASVVSRQVVQDLDLVQIKLSNGIRLNLKHTDYEADKVTINIAFGNGKAGEPSDHPGLSLLAEEVINESGFGSMDKQALARALAGKNADFSFSVKEDYFLVSGQASKTDAELLCQLLYTFFKDPGMRQRAFDLAMERFRLRYQRLATKPEGMLMLKGRRFLAGGDYRFGWPPWEQFKRLELEDLQKWLNPAIKKQSLEVSMVGDMSTENMARLARTYFGALGSRSSIVKPTSEKGPMFPSGKKMTVRVASRIPKALLVIAYPTEDFWKISRTRRLSLLAEVFSERLRVRIREQLGVSYSPVAFNRSFRAYTGYGLLQVFIHIAPEKAQQVVSAVRKIAHDLKAHGVSEDELLRVKNPILTSIKDMRQTNSYWLDSVLTGCSRYPQQLDWSRTIEADYASITGDDIKNLAGRYLDNTKAAVFLAVPQKKDS